MKTRLTKYVVVYVVQGNYGYGDGWEDLCCSDVRSEARADLKAYRENDPNPTRLIRRRVLRSNFEAGNF
jgi:hypothetical protein